MGARFPAFQHIPVMRDEAVGALNCAKGKIMVDATVGGAGHAKAIAEQILPEGLLIGIDRDHAAIAHSSAELASFNPRVRLYQGSYTQLGDILKDLQIDGVDGILMDLGMSRYQIEASGRGFSFLGDEPLDMRMDTGSPTTAADLINRLKEAELKKLFRDFGEERWSGRIAHRIVRERKQSRITTTRELSGIVRQAIPPGTAASQRIHPATRVFMALRIAVNRELEHLKTFMSHICDWLNPGGRFCALSFHSLEDRIVKHQLKEMATGCTCPPDMPRCNCNKTPRMRILTRKPLRPSATEVSHNPLARSTRLRAAERL